MRSLSDKWARNVNFASFGKSKTSRTDPFPWRFLSPLARHPFRLDPHTQAWFRQPSHGSGHNLLPAAV